MSMRNSTGILKKWRASGSWTPRYSWGWRAKMAMKKNSSSCSVHAMLGWGFWRGVERRGKGRQGGAAFRGREARQQQPEAGAEACGVLRQRAARARSHPRTHSGMRPRSPKPRHHSPKPLRRNKSPPTGS